MNGRLLRRSELTPALEDDMFALLGAHFDGLDREHFRADLDEKNFALLITDDAGRLIGFSTLLFYPARHRGEELAVVYSGDTIVDPAAWNSSVLSRSWIEAVQRLHAREGKGRLMWLLITSGFRTYRMLPLFWREFYPRCDERSSNGARELRDALARERFGARYDPGTGVVRLERPQVLKDHLCGIPERKLRDRHVAFFDRANPGHERGDELVCVTELSPANLTRAGRRMVRAGHQRGIAEGTAD